MGRPKKMLKDKHVPVTCYMEPAVLSKLKALAKVNRRTVSASIALLVDDAVASVEERRPR